LADTREDVVILIDRGLMDGSAYVSRGQWQALMDDLGVSTAQIRDKRYDAIIHMVTAADGADDFYATQIAGEARYESKDEAKEKDELLRQAYMGHQKWILISNKDCIDFKDKI
jgi:predicted ATPase